MTLRMGYLDFLKYLLSLHGHLSEMDIIMIVLTR